MNRGKTIWHAKIMPLCVCYKSNNKASDNNVKSDGTGKGQGKMRYGGSVAGGISPKGDVGGLEPGVGVVSGAFCSDIYS